MKRLAIILGVLFGSLLFVGNASAATQVADAKASLEGLYQCYSQNGFESSMKPNTYSFSNSSYYKNLSMINSAGKRMSLPLPTGHFDKSTVNCQDILIGSEGSKNNTYPGLTSMYSFSFPESSVDTVANSQIEQIFSKMGYEKKESVTAVKRTGCFNLPYSSVFVGDWPTGIIVLDDAIYTQYACIEVDCNSSSDEVKNCTIVNGADWHITDGPLNDTFDSAYWETSAAPDGGYAQLWLNVKKSFLGGWECFGLCKSSAGFYIGKGKSQTLGGFANDFYQKAVELGAASYSSMSYYYPGEPQYWKDPVDENVVTVTYELKSPATSAGLTAIKNITNQEYQTYDSLKFTSDQVFDLYMDYLKNYYNSGSSTIYCGADGDTEFAYYDGKVNTGEYVKFTIKTNDYPNGKVCYAAAPTQNKNKKVYGVNSSTMHFDGTQLTFDEMFAALDGMTIEDEIPEQFMVAPSSSLSPDGTSGDTGEKTCGNSGGAKSLGWIVCPILEWMGDAVNDIYTGVLEPRLQVSPTLFSGNNGYTSSDTYQVWQTFQGFANIVFIIILLVVIFSQLTGVGIDNYGIKKTLPKLIVAALLVNLSYIICMVCVDLSNILGNALNDMFHNLGTTGQITALQDTSSAIESAVISVEGGGSAAGSTAITGVLILVALVGMGGAIWANPAIILSLLVGALGVLIAVLFIFILLAAREAAIVVLVVISPLAFVCYMLPNTKKLFDRWLKMGQGLLLLYPICGLLIGAGDFVSRLLLSAGTAKKGFVSALTAMLVGIVPLFFIPTMLRNSFSAMGNLGAKISGFGQRLSSGATRGIRNTEGYKAAQTKGQERRTRVKAGYDSKGNVTRLGAAKARFARSGVGKLIGYQGLQAAHVAAYNKNKESGIQANAELNAVDMQYQNAQNAGMSEEALFTQRLEAARDRGDANEMFAVIEQAKKSNMQASHISDMTRKVLGSTTQYGKMSSGQRKNFLEEFGKRYSGDFLRKDFEQADWARKGGVGVGGVSGLTGWAGSNIAVDDMKDEDVAGLSSANLHSLIAGGKISQSQAQRVWASNSNMDDAARLIMGAYAAGANGGAPLTKQESQAALVGNYGSTGLTKDMVDAYTRRAAEATVIEDVRIRNVNDGSDTQTNDLYVRTRDGGTPAPAPAPAPTPGPAPAASSSDQPQIIIANGHEGIDELRRMAGQGGRPS